MHGISQKIAAILLLTILSTILCQPTTLPPPESITQEEMNVIIQKLDKIGRLLSDPPKRLRDFSSREELETFLSKSKVRLYTGFKLFRGGRICINATMMMLREAEDKGYRMYSMYVAVAPNIVGPYTSSHLMAIASVPTEEKLYLIEPQTCRIMGSWDFRDVYA